MKFWGCVLICTVFICTSCNNRKLSQQQQKIVGVWRWHQVLVDTCQGGYPDTKQVYPSSKRYGIWHFKLDGTGIEEDGATNRFEWTLSTDCRYIKISWINLNGKAWMRIAKLTDSQMLLLDTPNVVSYNKRIVGNFFEKFEHSN